ncbi:MAG: TIGR00300 family protein [Verrucomicrobia bacterium]|nr:TIGR00300 family protein [Verrucomicrobiota bacterium]
MDRILMCEPKYFGVEYVINPWMEGHVGLARPAVARKQWDGLHAEVSKRARVELVAPAKGLPDMVFTANAGTVLEDEFVPTVFRVAQRAPEIPLFVDWFREAGFKVVELPDDHAYEGEGDGLFHPGPGGPPRVWAGYGVRSSLESHAALGKLLNVEVISLRLVDERFYHLDTCFVPLPGGRLLYYPAAFDKWSLRTIEQLVPAENRLLVEEADAMRFACNAVRIGTTFITNHAGPNLRRSLDAWGYEVVATPLDEFMLAGGAAKCLCLLLQQDTVQARRRKSVPSPIRDTQVEIQGHLLDTGLMNRVIDKITEAGGGIRIESFSAGERHDQPSIAQIRVTAPSAERLDMIVTELLPMGVKQRADAADARLETVEKDGVAPDDFYSTTIFPTDVRVRGKWLRATGQRMDVMIVIDDTARAPVARCTLMRDLRRGDKVVCGVGGVRVLTPPIRRHEGEFAFMSSGVSSERRVETAVDQLAWEMRRIKARAGKIAVVGGPVVVHTGGAPHLSNLIRHGYVQVLLTGNALPAHDIEYNLYGTSLGLDLKRGVGVPHGHQHHLRAINKVRRAGSIRAAVEESIITGGVMYECVKHGVDYVLAGSIRDDGPLPDTIMDLEKAQAAYARAIEGADMILMLSTMLHAIGTGNMTPAGVRLVCVDISPAVVTKLADRGSVESIGIVTDVGLLLNLLAQRLCAENQ